MKFRNLISVVSIAILMASCGAPGIPAFEVTNPFNEPVPGKAVVLPRAVVQQFVLDEMIGPIDVVVVNQKGDVMASQTDDINGDGNWDELVFLADFGPNETQKFRFEAVNPADMPEFTKRTNIRFARKDPPHEPAYDDLRLKSTDSPTISAIFQMEGPGWENDLVGFRNYFDARNGIDIFGKTTTDMILDIAGIDGQNYHVMDDWGMDNLIVGNSLGAGAIAIGIDGEVYRVGPADKAGFRLVTEGPVRSIIDLTFEGVTVGDRKYDLVHRISIYAGDHFYRAKVWVDNLQGDEVLYTGIVDMHELELFQSESAGFTVFGSHGNQGYDGEILGLGILIPTEQFKHQRSAPETGDGVIRTFLTAIELEPGIAAEYAFFSGWEYQDTGFAREIYFREMLNKAAFKLDDSAWLLP
ncbi:DUF4861 domain-containing protein [Natronoflexus pectinivorans]|uniref:Uncharacterized protein DUF4861 n=1 Tax=Natronoflexus pectinivorans TaxID=682526 RepID=A0A4R2GG54_9BACT|nr:DUF4861 domain-containing protein [Natronoflexus pectinivorans]TCO07243.1 uncharacterized protein DUF4861 [Natronoflexus pectinivorans]